MRKAYHGGAFFNAVGNDFADLKRGRSIISADVLDAWFDPSPKVIRKLRSFLPYTLKTSPPTHAEGLINVLAKKHGITENSIMVAGGSSDIMMLLFPAILKRNDSALILDPTYGEYQHIFENVLAVKTVRHLLKKQNRFRVDVDALIRDIKVHRPRVVTLVNPNSPTGIYLTLKKMRRILNTIKKDAFLVVDETYIDYVGREHSLEKIAATHPNLVVIKSMSKVYALSGARVGYLVAHPRNIDRFSRLVPPWSVGLIGQIAAVEALRDKEYYEKKYKETHLLRRSFLKELAGIPGITLYDSCANFFLIELGREIKMTASEVVRRLIEKNIFLRNCDSMSVQFHNDFLRVAVKHRAANKKITAALKEVLTVSAGRGKARQ